MRVVITAAAKLDLFNIGEDIWREAPARADPFVQALEVTHILHGARDYESLLFPDA